MHKLSCAVCWVCLDSLVLVVFGAWCRACNFISVHCALCAMFCVQCKAYAQTTSCTGKSLHVQFTRRNALHCAGCSVFLGPVYFVHQLRSVFQSVCNVRATSKVCNANCANVVRFALCRMFQCPACSVHKLCSVPRQCAMCVQQARWALLRVLGVHCANVVCVQSVSVPRLPCAQAVYSAPSLCNVCVHTL